MSRFKNQRPLKLIAIVTASITMLSGCALTQSTEKSEDAPLEVAYLSASSSNTWLDASREGIEEAFEGKKVKLTEFDAKFEPGLMANQIQDIIASGQYDGILLTPFEGAAVAPAVADAIAAGLKVVSFNSTLGTSFDTAEPAVDGLSGSVMNPRYANGQRLGELVLDACEGADPCRVVYMWGLKGLPDEEALRSGFDDVISQNPAIEVVAEAEGGFLGTDEPLKATQDLLQANPEFEVFAATGDQSVRGALLAFEDAGVIGVKAIGIGGSAPALKAIAEGGLWFGDVAGAPQDEGRLAAEALLAAIEDGTESGGIDPLSYMPDNGLITRENVDQFKAQWNG